MTSVSDRSTNAIWQWRRWLPGVSALGILVICAVYLLQRYVLPETPALPSEFSTSLDAWIQARQGLNPYQNTSFRYAPSLLGFFGALPPLPHQAWRIFAGFSIFSLVAALGIGARYFTGRAVGALLLGLVLGAMGIRESLDHAQFELAILLLGVMAARLYAFWPATAGFLLGIIPAFQLSWALFFLPFVLRALSHRDVPYPKNRFYRRLVSGYFLAWFSWAAAIPSLLFGPERAKSLSQDWVRALGADPLPLDLGAPNHSLMSVGLKLFAGHPELVVAFFLIAAGTLLAVLLKRSRGIDPERGVLAWIGPWFIFTELVSPLASRCGNAFAAGVFFGASRKKVAAAVVLLWLLQQGGVAQLLGLSDLSALHRVGVITLYWLALIFV